MGGGHRGAAVGLIQVPDDRAEDLMPRSPDMGGPPPIVREESQGIGSICSRHGNDIGQVITGRVKGGSVVVTGVIACGSDKEDPPLPVSIDRVMQSLGKPTSAPAVVGGDDVYPPLLHGLHI